MRTRKYSPSFVTQWLLPRVAHAQAGCLCQKTTSYVGKVSRTYERVLRRSRYGQRKPSSILFTRTSFLDAITNQVACADRIRTLENTNPALSCLQHHRLQLSRNLRDSPGFFEIVPGPGKRYYRSRKSTRQLSSWRRARIYNYRNT